MWGLNVKSKSDPEASKNCAKNCPECLKSNPVCLLNVKDKVINPAPDMHECFSEWELTRPRELRFGLSSNAQHQKNLQFFQCY